MIIPCWIQNILPHHLIAKAAHLAANTKQSWFKNFFIKQFMKYFPVNMAEAKQEDPCKFKSFNAFFTRELKLDEVRPKPEIPCVLSPADGIISQMGQLQNQILIQAKGQYYYIDDLLGQHPMASNFYGGNFATIYLAPKDYHRVHIPVNGKLVSTQFIPGRLFSVNSYTTNHLSQLFTRNERLCTFFQTSMGKMALVFVGSMIVGSISTTWAGKFYYSSMIETHAFKDEPKFDAGEEIGHFEMGSTVIILFEPKKITWCINLNQERNIQVRQKIGIIN